MGIMGVGVDGVVVMVEAGGREAWHSVRFSWCSSHCHLCCRWQHCRRCCWHYYCLASMYQVCQHFFFWEVFAQCVGLRSQCRLPPNCVASAINVSYFSCVCCSLFFNVCVGYGISSFKRHQISQIRFRKSTGTYRMTEYSPRSAESIPFETRC